jgi:putative acetyltransferase
MIEILPLQPGQVADAKYVISAVAQRIFEPGKSPEDFAEVLATEHELDDVDNFQQEYMTAGGLFLVVLDDGRVVGTGAIRRLEQGVAELKRIWLLEPYHGRKIGYRVVSMLLDFARRQGYGLVRLSTSQQQVRAINFYKRVGFYEIPARDDEWDDVWMELKL